MASSVDLASNGIRVSTNTDIPIISGSAYSLSFTLSGAITSTYGQVVRFQQASPLTNLYTVIAPITNGSLSAGVNTYTLSAATLASSVGAGRNLRFALYNDAASFTLSNILFFEEGAPTPSGPSAANTQQSLVNTAQALQGTYTLQNSVLANSFSYDCSVFGENNVCVSAGGRNTAVSAANGLNNSSALLIAAYRAMANVRVGGYADQNLSVNNAGAGINLGNNTPLLGLFAAWNEKQDGTGTEVKASVAYGQKNTTMTRGVVGSGATASEAGSGSSQLNSQGAQITAKYGFGIADQVIVSPYVGIRYTQNNMGGYTEGASSTVTAPLSYSALNTNATTALAGVGAQYKGIPQTTLFASAGVETDTNTSNGSYNATNASIGAIAPVNFNPNPVKTRPTAMLGASYDVEKNQRLGVTGIYRQESYQATASTTVMATYTVGF
ncbi:autotransporter outer membrane beta-barrel domain-containing protein [Polynucleobacter paneuropaeus]|nr:autotransporter outer membrane beta-barrel domain-containing protein [Polynucleobacter paneuropaeus]